MEQTSSAVGLGILGLLFVLFLIAFGVAATVFWIWMLVHAIINKGLNDTEKIVWVLVIVFLHALGVLIYFFVGRPKKPPATVPVPT